MASERYSFSLTTFSPSGKLVQIEYALAAVTGGGPSVGIRAPIDGGTYSVNPFRVYQILRERGKVKDGVVIATDNKNKTTLIEQEAVHKIEKITDHIGVVYSGIGPDYRLLVKQARKIAEQYKLIYEQEIPTAQLVQRVATVMQEYTQSGGVRPFGVSLLICGWDNGRSYLFQCDPSGAYFPWKATAMGKDNINGKTFLEKRYKEDSGLEDAIDTAIQTLRESFDVAVTKDNIQVGICDKNGFQRLTPEDVAHHI